MKTLSEFVNEQIEKYELQNKILDPKKLFSKIRIKAQRELQKLGYWDNAKTKLIGKSKTRLFTNEELAKLAINMRSYMENLSANAVNLDPKDLKKLTYFIDDNMKFVPNKKDYDRINYKDPYNITEKDINRASSRIMLQAIFEHFYTPIDRDKLKKLLATLALSEDPFKLAKATRLLENPKGYLYKERNRK